MAPYYNKPSQEGVFQHYQAIHNAVDIPMVIYNIPGRSVINITDETLTRLGTLERVVAVKDATGDLSRPYTLRKAGGGNLAMLSGEDMTAVAFNVAGGQGCISVASNVAPKLTSEVQQACLDGRFTEAAEKHEALTVLNDVLFSETSPGPAKYALSLMGKCGPELRLPLVEPSDACKSAVEKVLREINLI